MPCSKKQMTTMTVATTATVGASAGRRRPLMRFAALSAVLILLGLCSVSHAAPAGKRPTRAEKKAAREEQLQKAKAQVAKFEQMKKEGADMISNTKEAAALRSYELRKKKTRGIIRKREKSISSILFPGMAPEEYNKNELIPINVELVESRKTQVPYKFYDLPVCQPPKEAAVRKVRKNLGARLQGYKPQATPYEIRVGQDKSCTPICMVSIGGRKLRWLRKLVERQYRVHINLDQLPVLMRSRELNYAVRG